MGSCCTNSEVLIPLDNISNMQGAGKVMLNGQVRQMWNGMGKMYKSFDSAPQTHYFTIVSLLKLQEANNILEIGCGTGRLLSYALSQKAKKSHYYATDFAENFLQMTQQVLKDDLKKYQSKLSFQNWCQRQHLHFQQHDVEKVFDKGVKFDRIICNLVLMLIQNPEKAIQSLYEVAAQGCLIGITVWGDRNKTTFFSEQEKLIQQKSGVKMRSNFHLYKKIEHILEKIGWQVVLNFQQNSIFPYLEIDENNPFFFRRYGSFPQETRKEAVSQISKVLKKIMYQDKTGIQFYNQIVIARKKK